MLRMLSCVFQDEHGVVHYRLFEPVTCCGTSVIRIGAAGEFTPQTIRDWDAGQRTTLPRVTCMLCLVAAETPSWEY